MWNETERADKQLPERDRIVANIGKLVLAYKWTVIARPQARFQSQRKVINTKIGVEPGGVSLRVVVRAHSSQNNKTLLVLTPKVSGATYLLGGRSSGGCGLGFRLYLPYAFEGMLRREIEAASGVLQNVQYADQVEFVFSLADTVADALIGHLNEAGQGRIIWGDVD